MICLKYKSTENQKASAQDPTCYRCELERESSFVKKERKKTQKLIFWRLCCFSVFCDSSFVDVDMFTFVCTTVLQIWSICGCMCVRLGEDFLLQILGRALCGKRVGINTDICLTGLLHLEWSMVCMWIDTYSLERRRCDCCSDWRESRTDYDENV